MQFNELGLAAELLRAVHDKGYTTATPIQQRAIPPILEGRDILASAQTGTGKTAGFTLPLLQRLNESTKKNGTLRALILTPTRELAAQVEESVREYGRFLPYRSTMIFGGVSINPQITKLRRGVDIVVATPGRLLDHMQQRTIDLSSVELLVLDEADRMLDMGFIRDMRKIFKVLPAKRQTMLFSATFSNEIRSLAADLLHKPVEVEVAPRNTTAERVSQVVHPVDRSRKREMLSQLIGKNNWRQVLVFARTKHGSNRLAEQLNTDGISTSAIHGNKSQGARTRALADFKAGKVRVLVATDIAARGLDIERLPHVVNYELPNVPEDYVHRIGRTARAGLDGQAVSLVCVDEDRLLRDIEKVLKSSIPKQLISGFEPDPRIRAEPIQNGRSGRGGNSRNNQGGQHHKRGSSAGARGKPKAAGSRRRRSA
ncbi:MAG: DEAD/DEAH box helicase [Woeseia sp.]